MNFLNTADLALESRTPLDYVGIDCKYLSRGIIRELGMRMQLKHPQLESEWLSLLDPPIDFGQAHPCHEFATLTPILGAAEDWVANPIALSLPDFDAIYLDAFSPQISPELWTEDFFKDLRRLLRAGGTLTSYCVKSDIQKRLKAQGFEVFCCPGPEGGKREVLMARKTPNPCSV